jgi:hypothetical protein
MTYLAHSEEEHREIEDERMGLNEPAYIVGGQACWTYEEACEVAGIETPAQLAREDKMHFEEECVQGQDAMEARGGPDYFFPKVFWEECPF